MDTASAPPDSGEWVLRLPSTAAERLFWRLNGPLETAIQVTPPKKYYEPGDVMEPYFGADGSPHPVSQASLFEPPVSSFTVRVRCIDAAGEIWAASHWLCHEGPVNDECPRRVGPLPPRPGAPDADLEASNPRMYLLECCGQKRPLAYDTHIRVAAQCKYLTVHEYVSAIHPWLMAMRDTLLEALGEYDGTRKWPPETRLAVIFLSWGPLHIDREDKWAYWHRKPHVPDPAIAQLPPEERQRRATERMLARSAARIRAREEEAARVAELEKEMGRSAV